MNDVAPSNFEVQSATEGIDDCGGNLRNEGSRTLADVAPSNFEGPRTTTCKCNATEGIDDCTCNLRKERFCFGLAQNRQCTRSAQLALQGSSREGGYPPAGTRNLRNERSCFGLALQGSSREGGYPPHAKGDATTPEGAVATGSVLLSKRRVMMWVAPSSPQSMVSPSVSSLSPTKV